MKRSELRQIIKEEIQKESDAKRFALQDKISKNGKLLSTKAIGKGSNNDSPYKVFIFKSESLLNRAYEIITTKYKYPTDHIEKNIDADDFTITLS